MFLFPLVLATQDSNTKYVRKHVLRNFCNDKRKSPYRYPTVFRLTIAEMMLIILLLYFTAQDVYAQDGCSIKILEKLNDNFFNALRKEESDGDMCKIDADKLGPYQISEEYYEDAVRANQTLKTGGSTVRT